jgi:glycine dehydrogenase
MTARPALGAGAPSAFAARHIGPSPADQAAMLDELGYRSLDEMIERLVPETIRDREPLAFPAVGDEAAVLAALRRLAAKNRVLRSFIGMGYYGTHTPTVIRRNVLENPAWYTAYTPYQPEISQGRLEALLNFQTMITDLTGLDVANASLLDEGTAAAEAMALCLRSTDRASRAFFAADDCHPQTIAVLRTRAEAIGVDVIVGRPDEALAGDCFGVLLQYPGTTGEIVDHRGLIGKLRAQRIHVAVATDLLALALLVPPGELGADIAAGSTQRFGVPMGYGGPHAAFLACTDALKRALPGRLVGVTVDSHGEPALRLALQTREQHIRREKATSNICTSQVLLAVMAAMYAAYHGPDGLRDIARRVHRHAAALAEALGALGWQVEPRHFFDTLVVRTDGDTAAIHARAVAAGFNLRHVDAGIIGISLDEPTTDAEIESLVRVFALRGQAAPARATLDAVPDRLPPGLLRTSAFLTHPVFHRHRSETAMLRYLRALADKDLALDRTMIPLGSCTMKLNATTEMLPITWPGFAEIHPFAPSDQAQGYRELIDALERWLCAITGYDACSLQPNSGAQGEFAGLLAIRAYHANRGEGNRRVVLVPGSAHGTNPASAHMAGYEVVVVATDRAGNVDLGDLAAKAARHAAELAAIMVTYPSTHGVFEPNIREACAIVHEHGGQVYLDGANLNALMGSASPGHFGADVSHLNLHKTFCIPHGGGGPGVGPVAVKAHLAPFLPGHPLAARTPGAVGPVASAPYGSAGILPISWAFIALMGGRGLSEAARVAVLSANYVAKRLAPHFPVLYAGAGGGVAHECILDPRPLKETCGVTAEDIAKRLIDYGIHAPTMSFPVAGTLMVEPTESEPKAELDRFIAAMIAIRGEIAQIEAGRLPRDDNPLRHAPHTARAVCADAWPHAYPRSLAAYPVPALAHAKYWAPVGRVDNVYGDRHLFCTCPPLESERGGHLFRNPE